MVDIHLLLHSQKQNQDHMDLFAAILVTITAITICGICVFIFVCALQPRFLRRLHGKTSRAYNDTDSNAASHEDEISVKSLHPAVESTVANPSTTQDANNRDKKAYLKSLERSIRTGRRIHDENDDDDDDNDSHSTPLKFIRHYINKYIRRKRTETTEL